MLPGCLFAGLDANRKTSRRRHLHNYAQMGACTQINEPVDQGNGNRNVEGKQVATHPRSLWTTHTSYHTD